MVERIKSESAFEDIAAYSRAVIYGDIVEISGTTSSNGSKVEYPDDVLGQTEFIFEKIGEILGKHNSSLENILRIRYYVTDVTSWKEVALVAKKFLDNSRPAATLVEVSNLIDPDMMIEIEVTAFRNN